MKNNVLLVIVLLIVAGVLVFWGTSGKIIDDSADGIMTEQELREAYRMVQENQKNPKPLIVLYTKAGTPESQILELKQVIENNNMVESVKYQSSKEVLEDTISRADKETQKILLQMSADEILGNFEIITKDAGRNQEVKDFIKLNDRSNIVDGIY